MSKHTPGPWHIDGSKQEGLTVRNGQAAVAVIPGYGVGQRMEDARLIAAAPELLEALKFAQSIIGHPDDVGSQMIAAAITKATGEPT